MVLDTRGPKVGRRAGRPEAAGSGAPGPAIRIGLVGPDPDAPAAVARVLAWQGCTVVAVAGTAAAAHRFAVPGSVDIVVISADVGEAGTRELAQALWAGGLPTPVLALGAAGQQAPAWIAPPNGVFLVGPFAPIDVAVRVRALCPARAPDPASVVLDERGRTVRAGGRAQVLTTTEFRLLSALSVRPGVVVPRARLAEMAWPVGDRVARATLDAAIVRTRAKLARLDGGLGVRTVYGVGYALTCS